MDCCHWNPYLILTYIQCEQVRFIRSKRLTCRNFCHWPSITLFMPIWPDDPKTEKASAMLRYKARVLEIQKQNRPLEASHCLATANNYTFLPHELTDTIHMFPCNSFWLWIKTFGGILSCFVAKQKCWVFAQKHVQYISNFDPFYS